MTQQSSVSNEFNAKLKSLNLDSVAQVLVNENGWTPQRAKREIAGSGYKRYLFLLHQNPDQALVPTTHIDEILHAHLSLGAQFDKDCQRLFGRVLTHQADFENGDDANSQALSAAFQQTKQLFQQLFGFTLTDGPAHCYTSLASLS